MCGKTCTKCKNKKTLSMFSRDKRQKQGRRPECKDCEYLRSSYLLKAIKHRILHSKTYKDMDINITTVQIDNLLNICHFCGKEIVKRINIHRPDQKRGYVPDNISKSHKSCHQAHHAKEFTRNNKGQFAGKVGY